MYLTRNLFSWLYSSIICINTCISKNKNRWKTFFFLRPQNQQICPQKCPWACLVPRRLRYGERKTRLQEPSRSIAQWTMGTFSVDAKDAGKGEREKWDASQIWFDFCPENSNFWIWAVNRFRCAILRKNNVAQAQEFVLPFGFYF